MNLYLYLQRKSKYFTQTNIFLEKELHFRRPFYWHNIQFLFHVRPHDFKFELRLSAVFQFWCKLCKCWWAVTLTPKAEFIVVSPSSCSNDSPHRAKYPCNGSKPMKDQTNSSLFQDTTINFSFWPNFKSSCRETQ